MSTPQSTIYICSGVRLDNRYEHTIYFDSDVAQRNYFAGKVVKTFSAYSYLRKSWPIQVDATMEQAKTWSYLYFQNGTGKYYYYFITQVEYKNDHMVELTLELDVLQTYMFDYNLLRCMVERQHTTSDTPGEYTVDEGLEVGELIDDYTFDETAMLGELCILVLASINPNYAEGFEKPVQAYAGMYDNVFSGLKVWAVAKNDWTRWGQQLDKLSEAGFLDGIISMWMYPQNIIKLAGESTWVDTQICKPVDYETVRSGCFSVGKPENTVDGYTPKNSKLLTYPYKMLYATNNNGESAVYRYERFASYNPTFRLFGCASPDGVVRACPVGYNGMPHDEQTMDGVNYEQGISLGGYPTCAWDADVYKMWLAQNQNQHAYGESVATLKAVAGGASAIGGLLTGNLAVAGAGATAAFSGVNQHFSMLAQKRDMAITPPQARGTHSSSVNIGAGKGTFSFITKTVSAENAKIIDDFFTRYGYKLNRLQYPNVNARPAFTYVKTVGCQIEGNLCTEDMVKIESIYDNGITFWKDGDRIADYSQNNGV